MRSSKQWKLHFSSNNLKTRKKCCYNKANMAGFNNAKRSLECFILFLITFLFFIFDQINQMIAFTSGTLCCKISYKLCSTNYIIQVKLYKLYLLYKLNYTSYIIQVILYKLYYTNYILQQSRPQHSDSITSSLKTFLWPCASLMGVSHRTLCLVKSTIHRYLIV